MRPLLLALALLPFAANAHDSQDHDHGSLGKHEHGVAQLNVALDGTTLELELDSPAMNLVGFEHEATSAADKATVASVQALMKKPLQLFDAPAAANCYLTSTELESPLFGDTDAKHEEEDHDGHHHADIHAHYQFTCSAPDALASLDFAPLFKRFPATQKIQVQMLGPRGQQGAELTPASAVLTF